MSRTIVLIYPRAEPDWPDEEKLLGLPLAVLTVARPLVAAGYDVRVLDENVTRRPLDELREMPRPLYVGISVIGGYTIRSAVAIAKRVGALWPGVPRVFGGWNPTLMAHLYEADDAAGFVDVVVRGRGEAQALAIARRLEEGRDLDGIAGVSWRDGEGGLRRNPDAPLEEPAEGPLPYDLIRDFDPYLARLGAVNYVSSYGCPHRCEFCGIPAYTRTFKPLRNETVVEQLRLLKGRGIDTILFLDDNFFTSRERVVDLARRLIDARVGLKWHSNGRLDQVMALDDDELALLARSGCGSVNVGYETGDQEVADLILKDVDVSDVYECAARFRKAGLHVSLNFMVGLPGEDPDSLVRSLETLKRVHAEQPDMDVCWYMFMPAPGTELWRKLVEGGLLTEPRTLAEHGRLQPLYLEHPWYYESPPRSVFREWRHKHKAIAWYFYTAYGAGRPANPLLGPLFDRLRAWCRFRYERRLFRVRADWWIAFQWNRLRTRARWLRHRLSRVQPFYAWGEARRARKRQAAEPRPLVLVSGVHRST